MKMQELNSMTPLDVVKSIENRFYNLSYSEKALTALQEAVDDYDESIAAINILLTGDTGVGKTTIVKEFVRRNPPHWEKSDLGDIKISPVKFVTLGRNAAPRDTLARIAKSLGIAQYNTLSEKKLIPEIIDKIISHKVRNFVVDESHHLNQNRLDTKDDSRHIFKDISNHHPVGWTLVGMPGAEDAVKDELQLDSRFSNHIHIPHYDLVSKDNIQEFKRLLNSIDENSPFRNSGFSNPDYFVRLFIASRGILRTLLRIIAYAGKYARMRNSPTIEIQDFALSFNCHAGPSTKNMKNPFEQSFNTLVNSTVWQNTGLAKNGT
jgi:hypothetical protein